MDRPYTTFLRSFPYGHLPLVHLLGRKWSTFGTPTRSKHVRPRGRAKDEACLIMTLRIKVLNQYLPNQIGLYQIMSLQFYSHKSIDHGLSIDSLHMHVYTFSTPTPRIAPRFFSWTHVSIGHFPARHRICRLSTWRTRTARTSALSPFG